MRFTKIAVALAGLALLASGPKAESAGLTNAEVVNVAYVASGISTKNAQMALSKTKNKEVRAFASEIARDHQATSGKILGMLKELNSKSVDNDTSRQLVNEALTNHDRLIVLKGPAFDKAYIENEAMFHNKIAGIYNNTLLPAATNVHLKELLQTTLQTCNGHLQQAQQLQTTLGQKAARL